MRMFEYGAFMRGFPRVTWLPLLAILVLSGARAAWAGPSTQAGPYRVEVTTDPATIPVGKAKLRLKVQDAGGEPVTGATVKTLTRMPGMTMGEREETAKPLPDAPGVYEAPASFPMGGAYVVDFKISGARGDANGTIPLQTGQSTLGGGSVSSAFAGWLLPLGLLVLAAFIFWRMKKTGQKLNWRALLHWQTAAGIAVLLVMLWAGRYAVNNWRRPGSMTPLEAQGMEMNMPAPVGATAVELATVQVKPLQSTVRYTGQAVGYIEQDVYPRVTGNLIWMPFYAGDKVKRGQLLARLDRSQIEPQIAGQRAAQAMAQQSALAAQGQYRQAQAAVSQAGAELGSRRGALAEARSAERKTRAELGSKSGALAEARSAERKARSTAGGSRGAIAEARSGERRARAMLREATTALRSSRGATAEAQSDLAAAREEKSNAEADRDAAQTQVTDAGAQLQAAQADLEYWTKEIERMRVLVKEGAVSREEFQREQAQFENAQAKVRQAQARVAQVQAGVRGAQSRIRRAEALTRSAEAKAQQAEAAIEGSQARIEQARADIAGAGAKAQQAQATAEGAGADISGAGARIQQMEADVRAARADIVSAGARVQQARAELEAHHAHVRQQKAAADVARSGIGQTQAGVSQAEAGVSQATTTAGYTEIRSLLDGVVTQRLISPGTLVNPGQAILKVAQINPIRLQANVAEADLQRVRAGTLVTVRDRDNKGKPVMARLTSVAPAVDAQTRTGLVEVIVPNPGRRFLPGEYVVMEIATGESTVPLSVPAAAVQQRATVEAGGKASSYVWVAEAAQAGRFTVRPVAVQTGVSDGAQVEIRSGLKPGQRVVTLGYQYLSEGDTVTTSQITLAAASPASGDRSTHAGGDGKAQSASIAVTENGFEPANVTLKAGAPARLTFTRKTDATCATEVIFPDFNIKKALPLNQPVTVEFTPKKNGAIVFGCGMDMMLRGKVVARR